MQYVGQTTTSKVVYGENDEVYFYDIVPFAGTGAYVKGVKNGDKIEVSLPQTVWYSEDEGYGLNLCLLDQTQVEEEGIIYIDYVPSETSSLTFTVAEDGSMVAEEVSAELMLGYAYTDDDTWSYYGVTELSFAPFNEQIVELPSDYGVSEAFWLVNTGDYGYPVNWAQGGEEVYFQGICESMLDAWGKGTVEYEDDHAVISIAQDQYLGIYSNYYVFTKAAKCIYEDGELYNLEMLPSDTPYQLIWDFEENTITAKDKDVAFVYSASKERIVYLDFFIDLKLVHQDDFAGTPVNPCNLDYSAENLDYYGCYEFYFTVPAVSTEGDVLDTNCLSYIVYIDGEEWEFDPEDYGVEESMVEIPWDFSTYGIWNFGAADREIDFYVEGVTTAGVQSVYKYNGEETRSEIVTVVVDGEDAVNAISADKKIASVKMYDVAGREVSKDAKGVVIKRVVYEDGTVASFKKMAR